MNLTSLSDYKLLPPNLYPEPPIWYHLVPTLILPTALLVPRTVLSRNQSIALFIPIIYGMTFRAWWIMGAVDVLSVNGLLWAAFLLVLNDPWRDFRYVAAAHGGGKVEVVGGGERKGPTVANGLPSTATTGRSIDQATAISLDLTSSTKLKLSSRFDDGTRDEIKEQPYPATLSARVPWVLTLLSSLRLTNWQISSPRHDIHQPPPQHYPTHRAFALYAVQSFILGYLALDITSAYISTDPYYHDPLIPLSAPLPLGLPLLPPRFLRTMVIGAQAWALITKLFFLATLAPLTLNYLNLLPDDLSPHAWPPFSGPVSGIFLYGVRGFWGRYWHQTMRFTTSAPGYAIADALGLRRGGAARYAVVCFIAFGLSGLVHVGLVPVEPLKAGVAGVWEVRGCVFGFFAVQPVAMLTEVVVARCVAQVVDGGGGRFRSGSGLGVRMVVNGLWTVAWFCLTLGLLGEMGRQLDYWHYYTVPVSIYHGLRGEGWVRWPVFAKMA
ncbi:hypothetical protein LTR62_003167 [Meristemomyces frigidus]|uniref:Wax synthase domain-containing protein n=1 Tax=Meristemomyces frigidus TaxID=1508187 RepID=A0AAN7TIZ3_9PEZI|nr:hypothetical protein LTR62_003167 [Meristemomyces frigidus]